MKPIGHRILVKPIKEDTTKGGIIIPTSGAKNNKGKVVFLGTAVDYMDVGDKVVYHDHAGITIEYEGEDLLMLRCGDKNNGEVITVL